MGRWLNDIRKCKRINKGIIMLKIDKQEEPMMSFDAENLTFVTEASDIGRTKMPIQHWNGGAFSPVEEEIELSNANGILLNQPLLFTFYKIEKMGTEFEPEVGAWVYKSGKYTLIIFND